MEPVITELTVDSVLKGINLLAPVIQGMWAVLSVLLAAVMIGAVWVTRISLTVKANKEKLNRVEGNIDPVMCNMHREACDKLRQVELGSIGRTLDEIKDGLKDGLKGVNDRLDKYQDSLLRSVQDAK